MFDEIRSLEVFICPSGVALESARWRGIVYRKEALSTEKGHCLPDREHCLTDGGRVSPTGRARFAVQGEGVLMALSNLRQIFIYLLVEQPVA
ncbi:hypothetical protein AVEN_76462-1 [Araneus ventricosus]|uniref:Uncharacterized protein n=1 Tax=Araneus ventricosus TaxID=182803 RepID=A0A4Y2LDN2_ARAVE|nr:hypothetical protein AVEN_76462-1 [Araneus ventricosus]